MYFKNISINRKIQEFKKFSIKRCKGIRSFPPYRDVYQSETEKRNVGQDMVQFISRMGARECELTVDCKKRRSLHKLNDWRSSANITREVCCFTGGSSYDILKKKIKRNMHG